MIIVKCITVFVSWTAGSIIYQHVSGGVDWQRTAGEALSNALLVTCIAAALTL